MPRWLKISLLLIAAAAICLYWYGRRWSDQAVTYLLRSAGQNQSLAELSVAKIEPGLAGITLRELRVVHRRGIRLNAPEVRVRYSLLAMLRGRLERVDLIGARIEYEPVTQPGQDQMPARELRLSLPIAEAALRSATIVLLLGDEQWTARGVSGRINGGTKTSLARVVLRAEEIERNGEPVVKGVRIAAGPAVLASIDARSAFSIRTRMPPVSIKGEISGHALELASIQLDDSDMELPGDLKLAGLSAAGRAALDWSKEPAEFSFAVRAAASEAAWGEYYADLHDIPFDAAARGSAGGRPGEAVHLADAHIAAYPLGEIRVSGQVGVSEQTLELEALLPSIEKRAWGIVRENLAPIAEGLGEVSGSGGIKVKLIYHRPPNDTAAVKGTLGFDNLSLVWPGGRVHELSGAIPLAINSEPVALQKERISVAQVEAGPAAAHSLAVDVLPKRDGIVAASPLQFDIAGGRGMLEGVELGVSEDGAAGQGALQITGAELAHLTPDLGAVRVEGRVDMNLGTLRYAKGELAAEGRAEVDVFGGEVRAQNIRIAEAFSSAPTLFADVNLRGIHLSRLTQAFSFGDMHGILDGEVRRLELAGARPVRFEAEFATRESGRRSISVKAINNIAAVSQGGDAARLSTGLYGFFDRYRYQKLAFACRLENDMFELYGRAVPGSDKYLLNGGLLPPKIDIVLHTPTISFMELISRLQRVGRAAETEETEVTETDEAELDAAVPPGAEAGE